MSDMLAIGCDIDEGNPHVLRVKGLEGVVCYEFSTAEDAGKADSAVTRGMSAVYTSMLLVAGGFAKVGTPISGKMCANCGTSRELCDEKSKKMLGLCGNWTAKEGGET